MSTEGLRLSPTSFAVLGLVGYRQPCTPYDLKQFIEQSVAHFWPVPHTTFYAEPARLAAAGLLDERQEDGGRRRKLYSLTDAGREALDEWVRTPSAGPPELRDELVLKIFLGADPEPLLRERVRWHEEQLAELQGYLESVQGVAGAEGVERSLVAGTGYHDALLGLCRRALEGVASSVQ